MNPELLRVENYRSFRGEHEIDLPDGLVAIVGWDNDLQRSNGSGKSTLPEGIELALFGRCRTGTMAAQITDDEDVGYCQIELTFSHAGETYRARRRYTRRGRKNTVDLERQLVVGNEHGSSVWDPITLESARATDTLIEETIGLTRETYRASAWLAQKDGGAFTEADPRDRKRIFAKILRLELWDDSTPTKQPTDASLLGLARRDRRAAESGLERLAGETRAARALADTKADVVLDLSEARYAEEAATTALATAEAELQAVSERYLAAKDGAARRQTVEAELETVQQALAVLGSRTNDANNAARQIVEAGTRLDELGTAPDTERLEARIAELQTAVEAHRSASQSHEYEARNATLAASQRDDTLHRASELATKADGLREQAGLLEDSSLEESCDRCGQHLGVEARARAVASIRADAERLELEAKQNRDHAATISIPTVSPKPEGEAPTQELQTVVGQLRSAQQASTERATLAERVAHLQTAAASGPSPDELAAAHQTVATKQAELDDIEPVNLPAIEAAGITARAHVAQNRNDLDIAKTTRARLDERLAAIAKAEEALTASAARTAELQAGVDLGVALERAFSANGIPALIVENAAIPTVEAEANRILADLGTSYRVELRTQAERKDGDGLKDTLDVVVVTETSERLYETFSGGEATRINLALRIALARLLTHRRGAESRLLAIDEPDGLDEQGMAALVEVLRGLESDFDKIYIVSHVPELRDSLDNVIVVVKDGGRSRIEGAVVAEQVEEVTAA